MPGLLGADPLPEYPIVIRYPTIAGSSRILLVIAAAIAPFAAQASCVWSDLTPDAATASVVQPSAARTYFVKDDVLQHGCPNSSVACKNRAYVTAGDVVLTGPVVGNYSCAIFVGDKGATTVGWIPSTAPADIKDRSPSDWTGHWVAPEQDLTIVSAAGDSLLVKGEATWGMQDPERRRRGGVHTGEVSGTARPIDGMLAFTMGDDGATLPYDAADEFTCRIRMQRRGPYLVVRDNNACGGANVSFSGVYRRKG